MANLTDSFKDMQIRIALFNQSVSPDEEATLDISKWNKGLNNRRSLSCGNICEEDFYPSEVGRVMILGDRPQEVQGANMFQNVTSCSSWLVNTQHYPPEDLTQTVNQQCQELFKNKKVTSGFITSTPYMKQRFNTPTNNASSMTKDAVMKTNVQGDPQVLDSRRDSSLWPLLLNGASAANALDVPTIFGTRKKRNTRTVEVGEITKHSFQESGGSKLNSNFQLFDFRRYENTPIRSPIKRNVRSLFGKEELMWVVKPEALTLDASGRGRLLLVNKYSNRNLKFKIEFNGKLITVSPQSGNLRSKSEIGLRVLVSRCLERIPNEEIKDIIIVTCGNIEKRIPVTICKKKKEKSFKDRSFKCF